MLEKSYTIIDEMGLHARPVSLMAGVASKSPSTCMIEANGMSVDLKSIMMVLTLGLAKGNQFLLKVDGEEAETTFAELHQTMTSEKIAIPTKIKNLVGIGASKGYAQGKVLKVVKPDFDFLQEEITDIQAEFAILNESIAKTKADLEKLYEITLEKIGDEHAQVFKAHVLMLEDAEFNEQVKSYINDLHNAGYAVLKARNKFVEMFENVENEYMQERAMDLKDVTDRLLSYISGNPIQDLSLIDEPVILIAHDLGPSDTAVLDKEKVLGFITEIGGRTSHTAIIARSLGIPAVVGVKNASKLIDNKDVLLLDGNSGQLILNPTLKELEDFDNKVNAFAKKLEELKVFIDKDTVTKDGKRVELAANMGNIQDLENAEKLNVDGVGLFRTEFIFMGGKTAPTEDEQFEIYKEAAELADGKPVIYRTLDIGGDKEVPFIDQSHEMNPFLGVRGVRLCLKETDLFRTQLRALLRASKFGYVRIMFPMISAIEEIREAKAILKDEEEKLNAAGIETGKYEVGMMMEVPAAAVAASLFADEVDFFSIGTNDLIQYTMASDRMNEGTKHLYQPFNPAIVRFVKSIIDASHEAGIWTGMCGSMASDVRATALLLALGLDEFSVSAGSVLDLRSTISNIDTANLSTLLDEVMQLKTAEEIEEVCVSYTK